MRICMVCPSYPPQDVTCGVGDYTQCLTEELARQGEEVLVVTSDRYHGKANSSIPVLSTVQSWTLGTAWWLTGSRADPSVDLIHLQYTPDLYGSGLGFKLFPLLARLRVKKLPIIMTFHTLTDSSLQTKIEALFLLATAHHIISANEEVSAMLRRHLPVLSGRWTEIPIGTNIQAAPTSEILDRRTVRMQFGLAADALLLTHFGLVYPGKGLETIIAALPKILSHQPRTRMVIIGDTRPENQEYRRTLTALADRLGVASTVIWAGRRLPEEVSHLLRVSDLFVVPYDDGASIRRGSLMAGLAHGLPVVSTHSVLPSSYLRDGVNVALVPPKNADALAAKITSLLAAPEEAASLAKAAVALAEQFSWSLIARETRALYARILRR